MTHSPDRRQGHRPAGARARQVAADAHEGTPRDFLCRRGQEARAAARDRKLWHQLLPRLLDRAADPRTLKPTLAP